MLKWLGLIARGLAAVLLMLVSLRLAAADERRLPVPAVAIRAGELIRDDMITERSFAPDVLGVAAFIEGRQVIVGRLARPHLRHLLGRELRMRLRLRIDRGRPLALAKRPPSLRGLRAVNLCSH